MANGMTRQATTIDRASKVGLRLYGPAIDDAVVEASSARLATVAPWTCSLAGSGCTEHARYEDADVNKQVHHRFVRLLSQSPPSEYKAELVAWNLNADSNSSVAYPIAWRTASSPSDRRTATLSIRGHHS